MEQLIVEWQNIETILKYAISFVLGILAYFGYLKQAGIKLATVQKSLEYAELKNNFETLQKYISVSEIIAIVQYISTESEKIDEETGKPKGVTKEIRGKAFGMFLEALKTEEPGHP